MRSPAALLVLMILACGPSSVKAAAEAVPISDPFLAVCVVSPGAQYTVVKGALRPVRGEFSIAPRGVTPLLPRFLGAASAQPGDLVRMYFSSADPVDSVRAEIRGPGSRLLSRGRGFEIMRDAEDPVWVIIMGIPPSAVASRYDLRVFAAAGSSSWQMLGDFNVLPREFLTEKLALTRELTALVTVPDPRKTAESKRLAEVLATADPDAVYEDGPMLIPLGGARRTSGYGDRRVYQYSDGGAATSTHLGVDIASPVGTLVPASGKGRVVFAAPRILTGNTVIIEHLPGLFSVYYHMATLAVAVGDLVERGATVGTVGMTGFATGPHLHFEVEVEGTPVDPDALSRAALLDKEPIFPDTELHFTGEGR